MISQKNKKEKRNLSSFPGRVDLGGEGRDLIGGPFFRAVLCLLGIDAALESAADGDLIPHMTV
jgi:hypothetical protein